MDESLTEEELVDIEELGFGLDDEYKLYAPEHFLKKKTESFRCLAQCEMSKSSLYDLDFSKLNDPDIEQAMAAYDIRSITGKKSSVFSQFLICESNDNIKYETMCRDLNVVTCSRILDNLNKESLDLKYFGVNLKQMKAMVTALKGNTTIRTLDLEENFLCPEVTGIIADLLTENGTLRTLNLKECRIGPEGAERLNEGIQNSQFIEDLDLSFNSLGNHGLRELKSGLCENSSIKKLNLGHNNLTEECCADLERILIENFFIHDLDLCCNFLNSEAGLKQLSNGLRLNTSVRRLNLTWNGLEFMESMTPLCNYLWRSKLQYLDLSGNRLTGSALQLLRNAVYRNNNLEYVSLAKNCLTPDEAFKFSTLLLTKRKLKTINLEDIVVEKRFKKLRDEIESLGKKVIVGHILGDYQINGPDIKKLLFKRCKFLAMKPKRKNLKKDFGHVILSLPEHTITRAEFEAAVQKCKVKRIDPDLITELIKQFKAGKGLINAPEMIKSYMSYYPNTVLPPVKEKIKKGQKGSKSIEEEEGKASDSVKGTKKKGKKDKKGHEPTTVPVMPTKSGIELIRDAKENILKASETLVAINKAQSIVVKIKSEKAINTSDLLIS